MQAVILAGGLGTRLRPLTEQMPKVMAPINGKPFLLELLKFLNSQGIRDIVLCTGYLGNKVRDFFGDGTSLGLKISYSQEKEELLGTGGALKQAQSLLGDNFFVINGDTYLPIDYREIKRAFLSRGKKALMVVYTNQEYTGTEDNVALDNELVVTRHDKKSPDSGLEYVEAGVLAFKREVLELIDGKYPISLERGLYPALIGQKELAAYITQQRYYDIGTQEQHRIFAEFLKGDRNDYHPDSF